MEILWETRKMVITPEEVVARINKILVRDCHKNTYLFDVENDNLKELMGEGA